MSPDGNSTLDGAGWFRTVEAGSWSVEAFPGLMIEMHLVGTQHGDGTASMMLSIDGDNVALAGADEVLMMAATLTRAAEEIMRIEAECLG